MEIKAKTNKQKRKGTRYFEVNSGTYFLITDKEQAEQAQDQYFQRLD